MIRVRTKRAPCSVHGLSDSSPVVEVHHGDVLERDADMLEEDRQRAPGHRPETQEQHFLLKRRHLSGKPFPLHDLPSRFTLHRDLSASPLQPVPKRNLEPTILPGKRRAVKIGKTFRQSAPHPAS